MNTVLRFGRVNLLVRLYEAVVLRMDARRVHLKMIHLSSENFADSSHGGPAEERRNRARMMEGLFGTEPLRRPLSRVTGMREALIAAIASRLLGMRILTLVQDRGVWPDPDPLEDREVVANVLRGLRFELRELLNRGVPTQLVVQPWVLTIAEAWCGNVEDLVATFLAYFRLRMTQRMPLQREKRSPAQIPNTRRLRRQ